MTSSEEDKKRRGHDYNYYTYYCYYIAERRRVFQHGPKTAQDIPRRAAHDSTKITHGEPRRYQCGRNRDPVSEPC